MCAMQRRKLPVVVNDALVLPALVGDVGLAPLPAQRRAQSTLLLVRTRGATQCGDEAMRARQKLPAHPQVEN